MTTPNLLKALTEGGSIRTVGTVTLVVLGRGRGALVTPSMDFISVRKWTESRTATGIEYRDINLFMDRFDTCVARSGSSVATKGHTSSLVGLAKEMKSAGFELSDWNFPKAVRDELELKKSDKQQPNERLLEALGIKNDNLDTNDDQE